MSVRSTNQLLGGFLKDAEFDVVVVPDFAGPRARMFEARTLLFLGSWLENAGAARAYPLHVACIGEPPASVRAMAKRCQAAITVHEPLRANQGRFQNKLRGLEIPGRTPTVLLLDADIVVLADPSELGRLGRVIAVDPTRRQKLPEANWTSLFTARGVEPPTHRVVDTLGRTRFPYYNSGVIYLPRDCGLRETWEQDMRAIAELFSGSDRVASMLGRNDQWGLAVSLERFRRQGTPVVLLPRGFHVRWIHLWQGRGKPGNVTLFHAARLFEWELDRLALRHQLRYSRVKWLLSRRDVRRAWDAGKPRDVTRSLWRVYEVGLRMQRIWDRQVEPVLREGS